MDTRDGECLRSRAAQAPSSSRFYFLVGVHRLVPLLPFAPRDPPDSSLPSLVTGQRATVFATRWTSHGPAAEGLHRLKGDLEAFDEMVMGFKEI